MLVSWSAFLPAPRGLCVGGVAASRVYGSARMVSVVFCLSGDQLEGWMGRLVCVPPEGRVSIVPDLSTSGILTVLVVSVILGG